VKSYYVRKGKPPSKKIPCHNCGKPFYKADPFKMFCSSACKKIALGPSSIIKKGYRKLLIPFHHRADTYGYVFEHIIIAEQKIERKLLPEEVCHHIDKNKLNNCPENIMIFENNSKHIKFHTLLSK
jgi:hypothetical protein